MVDVCVIGGGIAGSVCASRIAQAGYEVKLIEKNPEPHHKLCGEFLSGEFLSVLGDSNLVEMIWSTGAVNLDTVEIISAGGKKVTAALPGTPIGISRYMLDKLLRDHAVKHGAGLVNDEVSNIDSSGDHTVVSCTSSPDVTARIVVGAYGRRGKLDRQLRPDHVDQRSPWLAFKTHVRLEHQDSTLRLYAFPGGYCGVSSIEGGISNMCWITHLDSFKQGGSTPEGMLDTVMRHNAAFSRLVDGMEIVSDRFYSSSQLSFSPAEPVVDHILMIGDSGGMIAPVCGDGMSMAADSAQRAATTIQQLLDGRCSRDEMEERFAKEIRDVYRNRMTLGKYLHYGLTNRRLAEIGLSALSRSSALTSILIRYTRG